MESQLVQISARIRIVLDTNVVVGLLVFADPLLIALREALDRRDIIPLADVETQAEFERVLRYPQLRVDEACALALADQYRALCTTVGTDEQYGPMMRLPSCRDRDDQKFLALAQRGRASSLLTRDKALLVMRRRVPFEIKRPEEWTSPASTIDR